MSEMPGRSIQQVYSALKKVQGHEDDSHALHEAYRALADLCVHFGRLEARVQELENRR
jgi:hypothetical protein